MSDIVSMVALKLGAMQVRVIVAAILLAVPAEARELRVPDLAYLVNESSAESIVEPLKTALQSNQALVRTTAARVALVRDLRSLLPLIRDVLARETDAAAAREEIRALALLGDDSDIDVAIASSAKWPSSVDAALASAIARRGGLDAVRIYLLKLRALRSIDRQELFRLALWGRAAAAPGAGSMLLGHGDGAGWEALLDVLRESNLAMSANVLATSCDSDSEEIRSASIWYIARGYAVEPAAIPNEVRAALGSPAQTASDREAFGRELIRRMLGGKPEERERWNDWLRSREADELLSHIDDAVYAYLTDREFAIRKTQCSMLAAECDMPDVKVKKVIPSKPVANPEFIVPNLLPAGIAEAIRPRLCTGTWMGLADVSVDTSGRVTRVSLLHMAALTGCISKTLATIIRLSLATNTNINSPTTSSDVLLVGDAQRPFCIDERPPNDQPSYGLAALSGSFTRPSVIHRVMPAFPSDARHRMGENSSAKMVLEAVISHDGCVRNIRAITQTPFPDLNAVAIDAFAQWTFKPATRNGVAIDVIYELPVNFVVP
jgi:hypothetical protein